MGTLEGFVGANESSVVNGSRTLDGFLADNEKFRQLWAEVVGTGEVSHGRNADDGIVHPGPRSATVSTVAEEGKERHDGVCEDGDQKVQKEQAQKAAEKDVQGD